MLKDGKLDFPYSKKKCFTVYIYARKIKVIEHFVNAYCLHFEGLKTRKRKAAESNFSAELVLYPTENINIDTVKLSSLNIKSKIIYLLCFS